MTVRPDKQNIPTLRVALERYIQWARGEGYKSIKDDVSVLIGSKHVIGKRAAGTALGRTALGGLRMDRVKSWEMSEWFEDRHRGLADNTRRRGRASLRRFLIYAIRQGWADEAMLADFPALKEGDTERRWLHPEQVVAIDEIVLAEFDDYEYMEWSTLLNTGARTSEVPKMRPCDLDPREKVLLIRGKGRGDGKLRRVPVSDPYIEEWVDHVHRHKIRPQGWMFFHRHMRFVGGRTCAVEWEEDRKRHISARTVARLLAHEDGDDRRVCIQDLAAERLPIGLAPTFQLTPRVIRRTFACLALIEHALNPNRGWDLKTLQEAMGHDSLETTQLYLADVERYLGTKKSAFNPLDAARRAASR